MMENHETKVRSFFDIGEYFKNNSQLEARVKIINDLVGDVHNQKILDLGCGDGTISLQYLDETNTIELVDFSENMLKLALSHVPDKLRSNVSTHQMSIEEYFSDEKYHLILCIGVLAHVSSIENVLQKVANLIGDDGLIVIQINDLDQVVGKLLYEYASWVNYKKNHYRLTHTSGSFGMKTVIVYT